MPITTGDKLVTVDEVKVVYDKCTTNATQSAAGLMSATDKTKLDGIAAGAQVNSITGVKGDAESSYRTGNVNITPANIGALALTGGTLTGALNLANNTLNTIGDDVYIGDTNVSGCLSIKGKSGNTGLNFIQKDGTAAAKLSWDGTNLQLGNSASLVLTRGTDASGVADNGPALIIGGERTAGHIEIDGNEIVAKSDGTHGSRLSLNADGGGDVYIGPGGLTIGKPLDIGSGGTGQNGVSSATAITFGTTDSRVTSKSGSFCKWGKLVMVNVVVTFTGATTPFNVGNNLDIVLSNVPTPLYDVTSVTYSGGYFFPARLQTDKTMRYRNSMGNGNISGQVSGAEVTFVYLTSD